MFKRYLTRLNTGLLTLLVALMSGSILFASNISEEMKNKQNVYKTERQEMKEELKTLLENLKDTRKEDKKSAIDDWKEKNRDRILVQKKLSKEIRKEIMEVVRAKKDELKDLSRDEQKAEMKDWLAENGEYLILGKNALNKMLSIKSLKILSLKKL